jgi:hypothetical protein
MTLNIPSDESIARYDQRKAQLAEWKRECLEIIRAREKQREEFLTARRENVFAFSADGRDLTKSAFEQKTRQLDSREVELLMQIKKIEAELQELGRKRSRAIVAANRGAYLEILRRRARAVVQIAKANQAEREFHYELNASNISSSLRPMAIKVIGEWDDSQSLARFHILELQKYFDEFRDEKF